MKSESLGSDQTQAEREQMLRDYLQGITGTNTDGMTDEEVESRLRFMKRHGKANLYEPLPNTEYVRKYTKRLKASAPAQRTFSENELKRIIARICEAAVRKRNPKSQFVWDDSTKSLVRSMMYYFANDPRSPWALQKGLLFSSGTGTGKTLLFEVFRRLQVQYINNNKRFRMKDTKLVQDEFLLQKQAAVQKYTTGNWCFDDLGDENMHMKHYGNEINALEMVLSQRYSNYAAGSRDFTFATTNMSMEQMQNAYGSRIFDRLREMMTIVVIHAESKRK